LFFAIDKSALVRYLENGEDLQLAYGFLAEIDSSIPLKQVRKELGLDS
jgi:hypothetical protein